MKYQPEGGREMFALTKVAGNSRSILGKYDTLSEAKAEGERIYQGSAERMMISLIEAEFDENDQIIGNKYKLYQVWR